jgi:hypothetical protein
MFTKCISYRTFNILMTTSINSYSHNGAIARKLEDIFIIYFALVPYISVSRLAQSVATDGRPSDRGSIPGRGERIFPLTSATRPALGPTQPPAQWVPVVLPAGAKARTERDADHSPSSSVEVEN